MVFTYANYMTSEEAYRYYRYIYINNEATASKIASNMDKKNTNVSSVLRYISEDDMAFLSYEKEGRRKLYRPYLDGMFGWWRVRIVEYAKEYQERRGEEFWDYSDFKSNDNVRKVFKAYVKNYIENNESSTFADMLTSDFRYFIEIHKDKIDQEDFEEAFELIEEVLLRASEVESDLSFVDDFSKDLQESKYSRE